MMFGGIEFVVNVCNVKINEVIIVLLDFFNYEM